MSAGAKAVYGVAGWKNSGKTTLVERLVSEFVRRGYRVATIKKAHHAVNVDTPGTDSFRHRQAGAGEVALVSGRHLALMRDLPRDGEPALEEVLAMLAPCDLVLVEGYKREAHPKIEVRRRESLKDGALAGAVPNVRAIAADHAVQDPGLPAYALDDLTGIADFIEQDLQLTPKAGEQAR